MDLERIALKAHTLKGAASNLGGEELRHAALSMEKAAKAGYLDKVRSQEESLKQAFDQLIRRLQRFHESGSESQPSIHIETAGSKHRVTVVNDLPANRLLLEKIVTKRSMGFQVFSKAKRTLRSVFEETLTYVHQRYPGNRLLETGKTIARVHNKKWDGSGYRTD